ncbi:hypothetical protein MMPV_006215 [Pyropia vietnamensis]
MPRAAVSALAAEANGKPSDGSATPAAWTLLGHLFAGGAVAVIYGTTGEAVTGVLRRAREHLRGGVLLGGMVGGRVVDATVWDCLVDGPTEQETRTALVTLLARPPQLPALLTAHALHEYLVASRKSAAQVVERAPARHGDTLAAGDGPPPEVAAATP